MMRCEYMISNIKKSKQDEKIIQIMYISSAVIVAILIICAFIYCNIGRIQALRPTYIRDVSIDLTGMIICGILIFSVAHDKPWDEQNRALFRLIFSLCIIFFMDLMTSFLEGHSDFALGIVFSNTMLYFLETLLIYCFYVYVREELKISKTSIPLINVIAKSALLIDFILDILNIKFGFFFSVNSAGEYVRGRYQDTCEITTFIIYMIIWYIIIKEKKTSVKEKLILLSFQIFPIIAHFTGIAYDDFAIVFPTYLFSVMLIYINVFAMRSRKILEQQAELDRQRATLMISQIQPHFLYNVLTTISNLCVTDPEEAEETTVLFSQYLRTNLDSLRKTEPVPFRMEMGHINTYVELEKKRFKDKLNVKVDCEALDFLVPALGIQPIVENSIKHGIRGKDTEGHLQISSRKVEGGYEVVIEDDGVGFDMNAPLPNDGKSHVGMINVRSRLEQICNAEVTTVSSPGNGCKTTIFFPECENS